MMKKRTTVQNKRLIRLIEFLEKLPREKFDFGTTIEGLKSNGHQCATIGCAIGWVPDVFRNIRWGYDKYRRHWDNWFLVNGEKYSFDDVAEKFLGADTLLFVPNQQELIAKQLELKQLLPNCGNNATPKQVAKMLRKYMKLVP